MPRRPLPPPAWLRVVRESILTPERIRIREPQDVATLLRERLGREEVEVFVVLALDSQSRVIAASEVTRGLLNSSLVHPREVFRVAILQGASGIIVAHNHPSGDPTPSAEDRAVTNQLLAAGRLLDIPMYDHVIIAGEKFAAFSLLGLL